MRKPYLVAMSLIVLGAMVVLFKPIERTTSASTQSAAMHQTIKGQLLHVGQDRDCSKAADPRACGDQTKVMVVGDRGELIEGRLFGSEALDTAAQGQATPVQGYGVWTYPDGSTMVARGEHATKINGAGQLANAGSQTCIFGTGRFADVDCTIDWTHTTGTPGLFPGAYHASITPKAQS